MAGYHSLPARRLAAVQRQLRPVCSPSAAPADPLLQGAPAGWGLAPEPPPLFEPAQHDDIVEFFKREGVSSACSTDGTPSPAA